MTIEGVFVNKHHGLSREPIRKRNKGFDRNRFKALIKSWIDYLAKINGKVHIRSKATNLQKTFSTQDQTSRLCRSHYYNRTPRRTFR